MHPMAPSFLQIVTQKPAWHRLVPSVLDQSCLPVDLADAGVRGVLEDVVYEMFRTLYSSFGVGLAAPQVGIRWQLAIIDTAHLNGPVGPARPEPQRRRLILINPEILDADTEAGEGGNDNDDSKKNLESGTETCLSLPGYEGEVDRPVRVRVRNRTLDGGSETIEADGFLARVILHEMDHLNGCLFLDRLPSMTGEDSPQPKVTEGGARGPRVRAVLSELRVSELLQAPISP